MKNPISLLLLSILALTAVAYGGTVPAIDVTVSNSGGKLAFKGRTNASGTFATGDITPDSYVVQFNSKSAADMKGKKFALVVSAGKKKVVADVDGEKFGAGGVAMKVDVAPGTRITGQVASGQMADSKNVKIIKGKRYVWVSAEIGSHLGGRWVEEGSPEASNISHMSKDGVRNIQDRSFGGGAPGN